MANPDSARSWASLCAVSHSSNQPKEGDGERVQGAAISSPVTARKNPFVPGASRHVGARRAVEARVVPTVENHLETDDHAAFRHSPPSPTVSGGSTSSWVASTVSSPGSSPSEGPTPTEGQSPPGSPPENFAPASIETVVTTGDHIDPTEYLPAALVGYAEGEAVTDKLLDALIPRVADEEWRNSVFTYVSDIVVNSLGAQVFQFGSGPLKTYLPDGDLDVSVVLGYGPEYDDWEVKLMNQLNSTKVRANASDVFERRLARITNAQLKYFAQDAAFITTDVFCIDAEVKIVKCVIGGLAVDISANQIGGFSSLGFLEEMNGKVGNAHLFKRASLLIKAYCFYEAKILGSNCWLLSTHALQTLTLYVFNVFHQQLQTPLQVLVAFLRYYSKFEWDKYCVSVQGPLLLPGEEALPGMVGRLSSQPILQRPATECLLTEKSLEECRKQYCNKQVVQVKRVAFQQTRRIVSHHAPKVFAFKLLNIVDPLDESNNLGRSVGDLNFIKIISGFKTGYAKVSAAIESRSESQLLKCFEAVFERMADLGRVGPPSLALPPRAGAVAPAPPGEEGDESVIGKRWGEVDSPAENPALVHATNWARFKHGITKAPPSEEAQSVAGEPEPEAQAVTDGPAVVESALAEIG